MQFHSFLSRGLKGVKDLKKIVHVGDTVSCSDGSRGGGQRSKNAGRVQELHCAGKSSNM